MMRIVCLLMSVFLVSCASHRLKVTGTAELAQSQQTFLLRIVTAKSTAVWVCYTEVEQHILQAVSCQNDTALPLFSAGLNSEDQFDYALISRRLLALSPENTVAYLQMILYPNYTLNYPEVTITQHHQEKIIDDPINKVQVQVSSL